MKRKIIIKRKDGIKQRYNIGRKKKRKSGYNKIIDKYISEPINKKGKGRCGDAAQDIVNCAMQSGVPKEKINVWGVQLKHPHKEGLSNHIITEIDGKFYDPTKTQYGFYDKPVTKKFPRKYRNKGLIPVKQNLQSFIRKS